MTWVSDPFKRSCGSPADLAIVTCASATSTCAAAARVSSPETRARATASGSVNGMVSRDTADDGVEARDDGPCRSTKRSRKDITQLYGQGCPIVNPCRSENTKQKSPGLLVRGFVNRRARAQRVNAESPKSTTRALSELLPVGAVMCW